MQIKIIKPCLSIIKLLQFNVKKIFIALDVHYIGTINLSDLEGKRIRKVNIKSRY